MANSRDPEAKRIAAAFNHAIKIVDASELKTRDLIESGLADFAGPRMKVTDGMSAIKDLTAQIMVVRSAASQRLSGSCTAGLGNSTGKRCTAPVTVFGIENVTIDKAVELAAVSST